LFAERGQAHRAAGGTVEQQPADPAFLLFDRLADPGLGDMQPLGGPAEVQLLGERQKDLDVAQLHPMSRPRYNRRVIGSYLLWALIQVAALPEAIAGWTRGPNRVPAIPAMCAKEKSLCNHG
jgi:hypothetical protein